LPEFAGNFANSDKLDASIEIMLYRGAALAPHFIWTPSTANLPQRRSWISKKIFDALGR
jgi:hypothetical protein